MPRKTARDAFVGRAQPVGSDEAPPPVAAAYAATPETTFHVPVVRVHARVDVITSRPPRPVSVCVVLMRPAATVRRATALPLSLTAPVIVKVPRPRGSSRTAIVTAAGAVPAAATCDAGAAAVGLVSAAERCGRHHGRADEPEPPDARLHGASILPRPANPAVTGFGQAL
jgi:hypothetical protein